MSPSLKPGSIIPGHHRVGRIWRKSQGKSLPPLDEWLSTQRYEEGGWSFNIIQYDQDKAQGLNPEDSRIIVSVYELCWTCNSYDFKVVYSPSAQDPTHCDLTCFDSNGTQILECHKPFDRTLKKYRKHLLEKNTSIFDMFP